MAGLSAAQLLPFLDLLGHSDRSSALGANFWTIPPSGWANLLVPLFHCYRSPAGVYFQPGQDWTSSYYPGVGILALGLSAVVLVRTPRVRLLFATAVLGFIIAMGEPGRLYPWLLKLFPPLGFMRYPIKFEFLTVFALPLLAAFAITGLSTAAAAAGSKAARWIWTLAIFLAATIGALVWYSHAHPLPGEPWQTAGLSGLTRALFLLLILAVALRHARNQQLRQQVFTGLLLLVLLWLDVVTHAPRQNPTVAASVYQPGLVTQQLKINPQPGSARAFLERQAHDLVYGWMLPDPDRDYLGRRAALLGDCNLLDGIPTPAGFFSVYVREQPAIFSDLFNAATNHFPAGLADFVGIAWLSNPARLSDWQFRPSSLPVCTLGPRPVFAEPSQMPALLLEPDFDARKMVYLAPETKVWLTVTNPAQGTVRIVQYAAQRQVFETEAGTAALLVLAQTYYHPWRAYVDDQPVRLCRANYAFQALEVPAGTHRVMLRYEDRAFRAGAIISLAALIGSLISVCWRRQESEG